MFPRDQTTDAAGNAPVSRRRSARLSIRGQIFAAFATVATLIGILGYYAIGGMDEAGRMVVRTFDMPLMAISHARLAKANFAELRLLALRHSRADGGGPDTALEAAIARRLEDIKADLDIAAQRSLSAQGTASAVRLKELIAAWHANRLAPGARPDWRSLEDLAAETEREFAVLVNTAAGDAFHWRQTAIDRIASNRLLQIVGVGLALFFALAITLLLARQILRPIGAASAAATRIAGGALDTPIPLAGAAETAALLDAMTVMQDNLRKMMAREIAEKCSAQRRLADALESAPSGIVLIGADGVILLANSHAASMFPAAAPLLAAGQRFESFLARARVVDLAAQNGANDALGAAEGELEITDGRWLRYSRATVGDGDVVLILNDISLLKDREANLRAAKEKAEAADVAKTQFLANMSHELRTPLNAVIGFSEMIAHETLGPVGKPQYRSYANDILGSGKHLLAIINDILDIAKSEAGTLQIDPRPVDVATLFDECAVIIRHGCEKSGLVFDVRPPPAGTLIQADPVKARQILLNLLSNAMKFTPRGGRVGLWAEAMHRDFVDLVVTDSGIGMRPEDIPVALAPFGQVDSGLARKYEGTGLGLPLSKILTELQGGELAIASKPKVGTTVRVRLPCGRARSEAHAA